MNHQRNDDTIHTVNCPRCYLCGSSGEVLYRGLKDRLFEAPGEWNLKKCLNPECGLIWLDPMPAAEDIGKAYQSYYTHEGNLTTSCDTGLKAVGRSAMHAAYELLLFATFIQRERKRRDAMYLDDTIPGKLLEVGCGNGSWLAKMRFLGWEVEGQDVDSEAVRHARSAYGLQVHLGPLESISLPDNTFDAITMNHVIEHVYDPIKLLAECCHILKPGGILVAVTPNTESLGHKDFASFWRDLEPPRHLHLFSQTTLSKVAKNAGYGECQTWTSATKAGVIAVGSFDIKREGFHKMGKPIKIRTGIAAALYHLRASIIYMVEKGSGEECILKARKTE